MPKSPTIPAQRSIDWQVNPAARNQTGRRGLAVGRTVAAPCENCGGAGGVMVRAGDKTVPAVCPDCIGGLQ